MLLPMNVIHLISYIALTIHCTSCCLVSGLLWWYALEFMQPKRKKSNGLELGDLGGLCHATGQPLQL